MDKTDDMLITDDVVRAYAASRYQTDKSLLCHAPFVNLNFEQNGNVRACCYNFKQVLGTWPRQSIKQIWTGTEADKLRGYISEGNLGGGCRECGNMLLAGNYQGVRARYYDEFVKGGLAGSLQRMYHKAMQQKPYPKVMEFELSNTCNLECVMCNGYFSSSIRKNREKLPPVEQVYTDSFVDELEEFIPHLTDAKFLGGEPFMIEIYLKIWERIRRINPNVRIHITTNGTFLNQRVKDLLEGLKAGIILSIDSVVPETYHSIRVNGNFNKVMENLEYFMEYTKRKGTFLSIAACPITYNWKELPELLNFCVQRNIALYFNAVFSPAELSLKEQSSAFLTEAITYLENQPLPARSGGSTSPVNLSINAYQDFIKLLKGWKREKEQEIKETATRYSEISFNLIEEDIADWTIEEVKEKVAEFAFLNNKGYIDKEVVLLNRIANLFRATPPGKLTAVIACYFEIYAPLEANFDVDRAREQAEGIAQLIEQHPLRSQILLQMAKASPVKLAAGFYHQSIDELKQRLNEHFVTQ